MRFRIGCSGWSYRHWRGSFYPREVPASRWYDHYASVFDTVELNGTFYRLPTENAVRSWHDKAADGFTFAAKASRLITHFRRLQNCEEALSNYLERIELLGNRLGPILFQLPPNFERDDGILARFLDLLPERRRYAFEFRHQSWWQDDVYDLLARNDAAFCAFDMGKTRTPVVATTDFVYVRFHGPAGLGRGGYEDAELRSMARCMRTLSGVSSAYVYFNNDLGGHAPKDALRMRQIVEG